LQNALTPLILANKSTTISSAFRRSLLAFILQVPVLQFYRCRIHISDPVGFGQFNGIICA